MEQTGDEPHTDEAETSTYLARVGSEIVPPLRTVATVLAIEEEVILLTSMSGVAVITKRSLISAAVPFCVHCSSS